MAELAGPAAARLILASSSPTRLNTLRAAGLVVRAEAPGVDEDEIRRSCRAEGGDAATAAAMLAKLKAVKIGRRHPDALVIGADQMLDCNGVWFEKPGDRDHARAHLMALRGRTHELISAVSVAENGQQVWHHVARARLTMRGFSDAFLDAYLDALGSDALGTVGAYHIERLGIQLFSRIEGDHSTILGLPLLPLLDFLRGHDAVLR
ncbi:MAG: Maf-like protein [Alphaproteobacteria bacterium]|nr:Maf-like protein [Alphaproteobacteria bacterium]